MANRAERTQGPAPAIEYAGLTMVVPVDLATAIDHLSRLGERFARLVETIERPDERAHGLEWTVAETAVHVLKGYEYYAACLRGETPEVAPRDPRETMPAYVARENRLQIDAEPERDPGKLAERLRSSLRTLMDVALDVGPDGTAVFMAGYSEDTTTSVCTIIEELAVHGFDIARRTGARWDVDPESAVLAVYSTTAGLPLALDRDKAAGRNIHVKIHLRHGSSFSIRFRDGRVWSEVTNERPDVHVSADPLTYLLVGFGRKSLLEPILRGQLFAWGRKPWVMLTVPKLFLDP
jgi:hypothetical protein